MGYKGTRRGKKVSLSGPSSERENEKRSCETPPLGQGGDQGLSAEGKKSSLPTDVERGVKKKKKHNGWSFIVAKGKKTAAARVGRGSVFLEGRGKGQNDLGGTSNSPLNEKALRGSR